MIYTEDEQQLRDSIKMVCRRFIVDSKIREINGDLFYEHFIDALMREIMKSWRRC